MNLASSKNRFQIERAPYPRPHSCCARRGQALVEFAVVSLVIYMLLAAILTFGHALYVAQGLQSAADLAAREISRTPLPATSSFDEALADGDVREKIFDEAYLVIDLNAFYASDPDANFFQDAVPQMPLLNQQLAMLMIVDRPDADTWLLRYPGALLSRIPAIAPPAEASYPNWVATGYTVSIPIVTSRDANGVESLQWVPVVEEIEPSDSGDPRHDPFKVDNAVTRGIVALRINFPFQSASMSSFRHDVDAEDYPFESTIGRPNIANEDESVISGTYAGEDGLGVQGAFGQMVRPYRRVISAQAIYRREVFE